MADQIPRLFTDVPSCFGCDCRMTRRRTERNDKGNKNRPFYVCTRCDDGIIFDDWEGIRDGNPECRCGEISRGQMERGWNYVYRCAKGNCVFREREV
ncbi:hypothetical protein BJY04DRAFT_41878 [Aspergillus karnatakaensis]|uniref:uncharacterized protein n=1 Tax=Aspergillus karnatakaensis TaxID=1810916 RepID=UPI003CCD5959